LVLPWSAPYLIKRSDHFEVKPFYIKINGEDIRVTTVEIETKPKCAEPFFVNF